VNLFYFCRVLITFSDPELADLYEGTVTKKEYRSNPALVKQYLKTIKKLESVDKVEQLYQYTSLHYEKLKGDFKGFSSVRINLQYRILFREIQSEEEPCHVMSFAIIKISKHYA